MDDTGYYLVIDLFSGRPNPKFVLNATDFEALYTSLLKLDTLKPRPLFDGLGFRGFILSAPGVTFFIEKDTVKMERGSDVKYLENKRNILASIFSLARRYDAGKEFEEIIGLVEGEYLR